MWKALLNFLYCHISILHVYLENISIHWEKDKTFRSIYWAKVHKVLILQKQKQFLILPVFVRTLEIFAALEKYDKEIQVLIMLKKH